jgi:hypothetical protein
MFYLIYTPTQTVMTQHPDRSQVERHAQRSAGTDDLMLALDVLKAVITVDVQTYDNESRAAAEAIQSMEEAGSRLHRRMTRDREDAIEVEREREHNEWKRRSLLDDLAQAQRRGDEPEQQRVLEELKRYS